MVRTIKVSTFFDAAAAKQLQLIEAMGLSTDSKPTADVATGSIFVEVDTGKVYFYNEAGTWVEQFSFQS